MTSRRKPYELGDEVTELAGSKKRRETVVLSVRVSIDELGRIEEIARRTDKTVSQVARKAITSYSAEAEPQLPVFTTAIPYFMSSVSVGGAEESWAPSVEQEGFLVS